jgi:cell wall-associated NlpC family hydrolase
VRDVSRRVRVSLWAAVATGIVAAVSPRVIAPHFDNHSASSPSALSDPGAGAAAGQDEMLAAQSDPAWADLSFAIALAPGGQATAAAPGGTASGGTDSGGTHSGGANSGGAQSNGAHSGGAHSGGAHSGGAHSGGASSGSADPGAAGSARAGTGGSSSGPGGSGGAGSASGSHGSTQPGAGKAAGKNGGVSVPASPQAGAGSVAAPFTGVPYAPAAAVEPGTYLPAGSSLAGIVPVAQLTGQEQSAVAPLRRLLAADLLVVAPRSLPATALAGVRRLPGVTAAELLDAARLKLNGGYIAVLGVDPSQFRAFAARPTAQSTALWQNVADGGIAVSYLMGKQERLPLKGTVQLTGSHTERIGVAGFGTVGISGVDAIVSTQVATSLGVPTGNAIVISAPRAHLSVLMRQVQRVLPRDASVVPLIAQAPTQTLTAGLPVTAGSAGGYGVTPADGPGLTAAQTHAFLTAALSVVGDPYVWGGAGPKVFDCSGLVQWSMRQAGIVMPRVASDQARTGPLIPLSDLQPGDLLFYHTDPTAPSYISHVAIYIGNGLMVQAPEPGMDVQVVPAVFDGSFAGAVQVYPRVAEAVAGYFAG